MSAQTWATRRRCPALASRCGGPERALLLLLLLPEQQGARSRTLALPHQEEVTRALLLPTGQQQQQALLLEMLRKAREELQVPKLKLVCHNTNLTALLFYNKLGFKPFDLRPMKNEAGETIVGIQMELSTEAPAPEEGKEA